MKTNVIVTAALLGIVVPTVGAQSAAPATVVDCATLANAPMDHARMDHAAHMAALDKCAPSATPTSAGQAAFGAISEVVGILKADLKTDWTRVNVEALRRHLIDMDDVTLRSTVAQRNVDGGFEADVTGTGRTVDAIRRMTTNHVAMLDASPEYRASSVQILNGARVTITARSRSDASAVARVRGLGFAGMLVEQDHHAAHHLSIARGEGAHDR